MRALPAPTIVAFFDSFACRPERTSLMSRGAPTDVGVALCEVDGVALRQSVEQQQQQRCTLKNARRV